MAVSVVASWSGTFALPAGLQPPPPACQSLQVPVANSGAGGNWLVAICGWRTAPGIETTVAVGDDAHVAQPGCNLWEPLGAPNGTSSLAGTTTASIWATRAAWPAANVYMAPDGPVTAMSCLVLEVAGLPAWLAATGAVTGYAPSATALPLQVPVQDAAGSMGTLADPLTGTSLSALWAQATAGGATLGYAAAGATVTFPASSTSSTSAAITSAGIYSLAESALMAQVTAVPSPATSAFAFLSAKTAAGDNVKWTCQAGQLLAQCTVSGVPSTLASVPYSAVLHAWWRVRESGGTTWWETSPDGANWTVQASVADPVAIGAMSATIGGGCFQAEANPGTFTFLDVDVTPSLLISAAVTDSTAAAVTGPGAAWTALPQVTASDGTGHAADCVLTSAWLSGSPYAPAAWAASAATDIAGVAAGIAIAAAAPQAPSQSWPYLQLQAGFGSGAQTPWDQVTWTDLTGRMLAATTQRGKQYELDATQAGEANFTLANNDGALTMGYAGSPFSPDVQVYTPVRLLATWPPPPAAGARTYPVGRWYMERWPQQLTAARYQQANATATDVYALLTPQMESLPRAEILSDQPYAYWPLSDPAGAAAGLNLAPGGGGQVQVVQSKYGAGGATSEFGVAMDYLAGDPGCTGWQQASVPAAAIQGWCLYYQDALLPGIAAGVTIEAEFQLSAGQPSGKDLTLLAVRGPRGTALMVRVTSAGALVLDAYDKATQARTVTTLLAGGILAGIPVHVAVAFTATAWTAWVDGGRLATVTGACNLANSGWWLCSGGIADRLAGTGFCNVTVTHLAVFGYLLPRSRVLAHVLALQAAMSGTDTSGPRIDRLLGDGGCAFPRVMPAGPGLFAGAMDVAGQPVSQAAVNAATSDSAWLMVDAAGYLALLARRQGYDLPVLWSFGENQAAPLNGNALFNGTVSPWAGTSGGAVTWTAAWAYGGAGALALAGNGTATGPTAATEQVPATPGTLYSASEWVMAPGGLPAGAHAGIWWYTAGGSFISAAVGATMVPQPGVPVQLAASGRAPATAATAQMYLTLNGTPPASTPLYLGQAQLLPPTEYAYLPDIATDADPSQLYDDVTITQLSGPVPYATALAAAVTAAAVTVSLRSVAGVAEGGVLLLAAGTATAELVTVSAVNGLQATVTATRYAHAAATAVQVTDTAATGVTVTAKSAAAVRAYGDVTYQATSYLADPAQAGDQAQWALNTTSSPANRVSGMTLDPVANPALWPVVLGLETGQAVRFTRRLQGTEPVIDGIYQVMSIGHAEAPGTWTAKVGLVPYKGQVLACDDTARGTPGGAGTLGW